MAKIRITKRVFEEILKRWIERGETEGMMKRRTEKETRRVG